MLAGFLVPGVNNGEIKADAEAGAGLGRRDKLGEFHYMSNSPAVNAAGHKNHVGAQLANALDLLIGKSPVVNGDDIHNDGTCAKRGTLGAFGGHLLNYASHHHLQTTAGAACGEG